MVAGKQVLGEHKRLSRTSEGKSPIFCCLSFAFFFSFFIWNGIHLGRFWKPYAGVNAAIVRRIQVFVAPCGWTEKEKRAWRPGYGDTGDQGPIQCFYAIFDACQSLRQRLSKRRCLLFFWLRQLSAAGSVAPKECHMPNDSNVCLRMNPYTFTSVGGIMQGCKEEGKTGKKGKRKKRKIPKSRIDRRRGRKRPWDNYCVLATLIGHVSERKSVCFGPVWGNCREPTWDTEETLLFGATSLWGGGGGSQVDVCAMLCNFLQHVGFNDFFWKYFATLFFFFFSFFFLLLLLGRWSRRVFSFFLACVKQS